MAFYKVNSVNSKEFILTSDEVHIGKLVYSKWYSFKADVILPDQESYRLAPTGFWESKIELKKNERSLVTFEMGWKGIVIKTLFGRTEKEYLLELKGLLSSKFVMVDTYQRSLLAAETDFKWKTLRFDFTIETSHDFEEFENKEVFLLTIVHCINYYMSVMTAMS